MRNSPLGGVLGLAVLAVWMVFCAPALGADGDFDSSLITLPGTDEAPTALAQAPFGQIYAAGTFTNYAGGKLVHLVRLKDNGTLDPSFLTGPGAFIKVPQTNVNGAVIPGYTNAGTIDCIFPLDDQRVVIGGEFNSFHDFPRSNLVVLKADGAVLDPSPLGSGAAGRVRELLALPGGKYLLAGHFDGYRGVPNKVALLRLNSDFTIDSTFKGPNLAVAQGTTVAVTAVRLLVTGHIVAAVDYLDSGFGQRRQVLLLSGSDGLIDAGFATGTGANSEIASLSILQDGRLMVAGGTATAYNFTSVNRAFRLFLNGVMDSSFAGNTYAARSISGFLPTPDNKLIAHGDFTIPATQMYRMGLNGVFDSSFTAQPSSSFLARKVIFDRQGRILVGGSRALAGGEVRHGVFRLLNGGGVSPPTAPVIVKEPSSVEVFPGGGAILELAAEGTAPLGYQWFFKSAALAGQNASRLTLSNLQEANAGGYFAIVSNLVGSATSVVAQVTVLPPPAPPSIETSPESRSVKQGETVEFQVVAKGSPTLRHQWYFGDSPIAKGTNAVLRLENCQPNQSGAYRAWVTNSFGSIWSGTALLAVQAVNPPSMVFHPQDRQVALPASGQPASTSLLATANGDAPLRYQWFFYGNPIARGTNSSLELTNLSRIDMGPYYCQISNLVGVATSRTAWVGITSQPSTPASIDTSVIPSGGPNFYARALLIEPTGRLVVGGYFTSFLTGLRDKVARLTPSYGLDGSFRPESFSLDLNPLSGVMALARQSDGRYLAAGDFSDIDRTSRRHLARLREDGKFDSSFSGLGEPTQKVHALAVLPDDRVLIGGAFKFLNGYGGKPRPAIARLNADGTLDEAFNAGLEYEFAQVRSILVQPDGKILIAGGLSDTLGSPSRAFLRRLNSDGGLESAFHEGGWLGNSDSLGLSLARHADGKILLAGSFRSMGSTPQPILARFNGDGSWDESFRPPTHGLREGNKVLIQRSGRILLAGVSDYAGVVAGGLRRFFADGGYDPSFDPGSGPDKAVCDVLEDFTGGIWVAGDFTSYAGTQRFYVTRLKGEPIQPLRIVAGSARVGGPGKFSFDLSGPPGLRAQIQTSNDLKAWADASVVVLNGSGGVGFEAAIAAGARFYRALPLP